MLRVDHEPEGRQQQMPSQKGQSTANNLVVFSPDSAGLKQLLVICSSYGVQYITFNHEKSDYD